MPLYVHDLKAVVCECCGGKHDDKDVYLHPSCHVKSPMWVRFDPKSEALVIQCAECGEDVAAISVAECLNIPKELVN